jgi:hypothetical protein
MDSTLRALHKNVAEWTAGPAGAVVLHLLIILALLFLVDFSREVDDSVPIDVTYLDSETTPIDPTPSPLDVPPPPDSLEFPPDFTPPVADLSDPELPEVTDFSASNPQEAPPMLDIPQTEGPLVLKLFAAGAIQSRIGEGNHEEAGRLYGGDGWVHAEDSVRRALEWLRLNQNADGSWGTNDKEAMSGLALLTFLAHGETTASEKYGETVQRAIRFLVARQNDAGEFAKLDTTAGTYAQAICVYALSEAYGMARILDLKVPMEKGVAVLIQGQQAQGGFDYRFEKSARRDTSLGGWCSQALKAAFIAGAENPRLKSAMDLAVADMKSAQKEDGSFYYSDSSSHASQGITAVAVLSMQLLGHRGENAAVKSGLDYLRSAECNWKNPPDWPMYAWYYISQTKFHQGGNNWTSWNNQFAPQFIRNQNPDGSWNSAGLSLKAGSAGRENMHPVYATTLAALTLQVYYRCLPTYKPIAEEAVEKSGDDAKVNVL